jgi:hypothetical protein
VDGVYGQDTIKLTPGVITDASIREGLGDDTFLGSHASDSFRVNDGPSGNETVYGRDRNDTINMVDGQPGDAADGQGGTTPATWTPGTRL